MPTIFILGDSTVDDNTPPFRGWGWAMPTFTAPGVKVENHGKGGRSSLSFMNERCFAPVQERMQPGDLLLIQFGHNDEKDDAERHTDPASTFPQQLNWYCDEAIARGVQPVLLTPVCRRFFTEPTSLMYTHGEYAAAVRKLAAERNVPLCDLKQASRKLFLSLGEEKTAELFVRLQPGEHPDFPNGHDDKTHFNAEGAKVICSLVVDLMREHPQCRPFLKDAE